MGRNIDLGEFGMCAIRCEKCGKDLDISELDIDCDLKSHNPMCFDLSIDCQECDHENNKRFNIIEAK